MSNYSPHFQSRGVYDLKRWKTGRFPTAPGMDSGVLNHKTFGGALAE